MGTKKYTYLPIILLLAFLFTSCLKKENPLPPLESGDIETVQIEIGYPYRNQVYYSCETNKTLKTNTKYDWDLSFECSPTGFHILLNTAKGEFMTNKGNIPFSSVNSITGVNWDWDLPNGNLDSTVTNNWKGTNNVYILNRQFNENGSHLGYKKIQFISVSNTNYIFRHANLDGSNEKTDTIIKNPNLNFIHFSFQNNGKTLELEPNKNNWDLLFTNHYHKFSNLPMPFVLTQVLINKHNGVIVSESNTNNFNSITLKDTGENIFSNDWNVIGYDWKTRNSQDNSFTIDPNKSYILKTINGFFYKIRFVDFYNSLGKKGYPKFEIQRL